MPFSVMVTWPSASVSKPGRDTNPQKRSRPSLSRRGESLLGAATVSRRFGRLVLDYVAVKGEARGLGLGKRLTDCCLAYAREAGENALWIAAKEPEFYKHMDAEETEDTALLADCRRCPDYLRACRPKELVFYLKETP